MHNNLKYIATLYFHGQPGSPHETYFLPDRILASICFPKPESLSDTTISIKRDKYSSIRLVGFSIGAMEAIKMAGEHRDRVSHLTLISPAAPLELGDFLPKMAGKLVFKMAAQSIIRFKFITALQRASTVAFPQTTINILFNEGPEAEVELASDSCFRSSLLNSLRYSYGDNISVYKSAILDYVRPWGHLLSQICCPVTIFHGEVDNWSPVEMAHTLEKRIATNVDLITYPQLGHFTTLHRALPILF